MAYHPKRGHTCDACGHTHNDGTTLVRMTNRDRPIGDRTMEACGTAKCRRISNERGYFSAAQIERGETTTAG